VKNVSMGRRPVLEELNYPVQIKSRSMQLARPSPARSLARYGSGEFEGPTVAGDAPHARLI
jgi:hypothetical protein